MSITLSALQKQRTDTAANWTAENPTLLAGELGFESDTGKAKLGTGSTAWNSLGYLGLIPSSGIYPLSQLLMPSGTQAAPSLSFNGDTDTGLYRTGANSVAISTGGSGRLFIDASGNVGINASPDSALHVQKSDFARLRLEGTNSTGTRIVDVIGESNNSEVWRLGKLSSTSTDFAIQVAGSERLRITSDGKVGVGTSLPSYLLDLDGTTSASVLQLNSSNATYGVAANFKYDGTGIGGFGSAKGIDSSLALTDLGINAVANLDFCTNYTKRVRIDSSGKVGIGTTSPSFSNGDGLEIQRDGTACLRLDDNTNSKAGEIYADSTGLNIDARGTSAVLNFDIGGSTKATLDNSGRLLVGTSTSVDADSSIQAFTTGTGSSVQVGRFSNNTGGCNVWLLKSRGGGVGSNVIVQSGDLIGSVGYRAANGSGYNTAAEIRGEVDGTPGVDDMPGRLVFSTTADGASSPTERMRISSTGTIETTQSVGAGVSIVSINNQSASGNGVFTSVNSSSTDYVYFHGYSASASATRILIYSNGNVVNSNNSYGAISDVKLKENIVDANSQWSDIKALQVRYYNFKDNQDHRQIGLIAQEVELVSPGLVGESPDRDLDGNDLGTVTKSVNYSVLYMKAVKALQEAMERIEQLETNNADLLARVTALEGN